MNFKAKRFKEIAKEKWQIENLQFMHEKDPFEICLDCDFPNIGKLSIVPFSKKYFKQFSQFYDGYDPNWDLSAKSRSLSYQHDTNIDTLYDIEKRVTSKQDARHIIITQDHVIGYLNMEELDLIKSGKKNYFGEDKHAMIDIAISDRFHGIGLGSFSILFLKLVAAIAGVSLYLVTEDENMRAMQFYSKNGFQKAVPGEIFIPENLMDKPWYILKDNESFIYKRK